MQQHFVVVLFLLVMMVTSGPLALIWAFSTPPVGRHHSTGKASAFGGTEDTSMLLVVASAAATLDDDDDNDNEASASSTSTTTVAAAAVETKNVYTLEYSANFHRHIVWSHGHVSNNGKNTTTVAKKEVVKSFAFIDEALEQYPTAQRLPIRHHHFPSLTSSSSSLQEQEGPPIIIAGSGLWEQDAYPPPPSPSNSTTATTLSREENLQQIQSYLETKLKWFPNQVQELFQACPALTASSSSSSSSHWTVDVLQERLDFLTSSLPSSDIVAQVNHSMVDWPVQFYRHGCGAGMSIAQLSYALSLVPTIFLRQADSWMDTSDSIFPDMSMSAIATAAAISSFEGGETTTSSSRVTATLPPHQPVSSSSLRMVKKFSMLYAQTPPLVLELARKQLDALHGASHLDCIAFSFLHWKGWEFHQMRIVIQALPTVLTCSIQPSWELYERGGGGGGGAAAGSRSFVRKQLIPESLAYLCYRLQIGPSHILAMLKTHARLSGYKVHSLRRNINLLQKSLHLSSTDLRRLVLRMPSLLGMSQTGIERRLDFWTNQVGLDAAAASSKFKLAILKQPSMLQYGVDTNLVPKLNFFRQELGIPARELRSMTVSQPQLWGRSLEGHLRPLATNFAIYMSDQDDSSSNRDTLSLLDFGRIVAQAPEIALCSWQGNLQDKLDFLCTDAGLTRDELKEAILHSPRILLHSLKTSLRPRLYYLQEQEAAASSSRAAPPQRSLVRQAIRRNPSLLLNSMSILKKRFDGMENNGSVWDGDHGGRVDDSNKKYDFLATAVKRRQLQEQPDINKSPTPGKQVIQFLLSSGNGNDWIVQEEFDSVKAASQHAGVSESHMYLMLRQDRPLKNGIHKYSRVNPTAPNTEESRPPCTRPDLPSKTATTAADTMGSMSAVSQRMDAASMSSTKARSDLLAKDLLRHLALQEEAFRHLTIYASGRAYPPEGAERGRRRSGGMALQAPSWSPREWKVVVQDLWQPQDKSVGGDSTHYQHPHKRRLLRDGQTLILGYAFTRPSRNRCSLYACLEALRVARVWQRRKQQEHLSQWQAVKTESPTSCGGGHCSSCCDIEIITDSNYCLGWLENTTRLYQWGSAPSKDDFCDQWTTMSTAATPTPAPREQQQQQHPIQRLPPPLHQANPDILYPLAKTFYVWMNEDNDSSSDHTVRVKFRKENNRRLGEAAQLASQLMYDTAK
jgi:mTERF